MTFICCQLLSINSVSPVFLKLFLTARPMGESGSSSDDLGDASSSSSCARRVEDVRVAWIAVHSLKVITGIERVLVSKAARSRSLWLFIRASSQSGLSQSPSAIFKNEAAKRFQ